MKAHTPKAEGWGQTFRSIRWHYVRNEQTLCGKGNLNANAELVRGNDASPDNCKRCRELRAKETGAKK